MLVEVSTPALRAKTAAFATVVQSASGVLFVSVTKLVPDFVRDEAT